MCVNSVEGRGRTICIRGLKVPYVNQINVCMNKFHVALVY